MQKKVIAIIFLGILGLAEFFTLYKLIFAVWMTAYPFVDHSLWRISVYGWFGGSLLITIMFIVVLIWIIRQRSNRY